MDGAGHEPLELRLLPRPNRLDGARAHAAEMPELWSAAAVLRRRAGETFAGNDVFAQ
jgi:hypothetical protein